MKLTAWMGAALVALSAGLMIPVVANAAPGAGRTRQTELGSAPSAPGGGKTVREPADKPGKDGGSGGKGAPSGGAPRAAKPR